MVAKTIQFDRKAITKKKLVKAVGEVLGREGFKGLGVNKIAKAAGVDKVLVYRYFGGLPKLIGEYSRTVDFWPTVDELLGPDPDRIRQLQPDQQLAEFFKSFIVALRKRPVTQDILAWELIERNDLTRAMEDIRVRTALEYFDALEEIPYDNNLTAIVALMAGAVLHMIIQSRISRHFAGIDLESEKGWDRINTAIDLLLGGIFTN